ncbi:MAG: mechanosensitive ion channel family protein [Bacteroidota bacterium]
MNNYLTVLSTLWQNYAWLIEPTSIIIVAVVATYASYLFYRKVLSSLLDKQHYGIAIVLESIRWPLVIFIWVKAFVGIINLFTTQIDEKLVQLMWKLQEIGFTLLLAWSFIRFIKLFEEQLLAGHLSTNKPDETTVQATGKLLRVVAIAVMVLFILPVLGIPVSGIVAFGGGSALVVGIATQQILANYFGGLLIYADGHFKVGDWIYSPDKEMEGTVEYIGWRSTRIRTFDKRALYVPNAVFSTVNVVNASRMTNRRITETIGVRYEDAQAVEPITKDIRAMLKAHPDIDQRQTMLVHFTAFGPYTLNINIYVFTKTKNWALYRDVQQDVFLKIIQIIDKHQALLAVPTNVVRFSNHEVVQAAGAV